MYENDSEDLAVALRGLANNSNEALQQLVLAIYGSYRTQIQSVETNIIQRFQVIPRFTDKCNTYCSTLPYSKLNIKVKIHFLRLGLSSYES